MRRAALAALLVALAGCGAPGPEEAVDVAERWLEAVAEDRPADACELMRPSASRALEVKYVADARGANCEALVRAYRERLSDAKLDTLLGDGLEYNGEIEKQRLGVFPVARRYQFEVVLMERADDEWKVTSVGLTPDRR